MTPHSVKKEMAMKTGQPLGIPLVLLAALFSLMSFAHGSIAVE